MRTMLLLLLEVVLGGALGVGDLATQEGELRGRLRPDEAGVPWAGAAVVVVETGRMVCAEADGTFSLSLPTEEETLIRIWPVGFPPTELTVTPAEDEMLIPVASHIVHLEGVVVTAYREALPAGSPYSRTLLEALDLTRVPGDVSESLEGKVPGAAVTRNSGAPGSELQIGIRGVRSILGSTDPLIVVDGVPVSSATVGSGSSAVTGSRPEEEERGGRLADLNTLDIAHVEVLRGIAASQRYGPGAANGVVVLTTRRGRPTEPEPGPDRSVACYRGGGTE